MSNSSEISSDPTLVKREVQVKSNNLPIKVAGAAIFGALSIVVSILTTENLPRMSWGIAYFDPVSIIWLLAFLIFGFDTGVLTCVIGMFGLMPFDPTPFVGPVMKFVATIWLVLIPYLFIKLRERKQFSAASLAKRSNYAIGMTLAWVVRCIVMIGLNAFYIQYVWHVPVQFMDMSWIGMSSINGWTAVAITVFILNTLQSLFDSLIPYLLVFTLKLGKLANTY